MNTPIAMIPYTNMAPYRQLGTPENCRFVSLVPRESIAALIAGDVMAAAVPVGGLARLGDCVEMAGRFGIAADGPCMSVMLFSRVPLEQLKAPRTLKITRDTASSVRLLYLLLGRIVGFDRLPHPVNGTAPADAELLIGDRALVRGCRAAADEPETIVTDLSAIWREMVGLPFVFARWVVRTDASSPVKAALSRWLAEFRQKDAQLAEAAVASAAQRLAVAPDVIRKYFRVIRRCLDERDIQGQQRFLEALGAAEARRPFPYAGTAAGE